jgi:C_GCAxxG_C_C family probable redox protein
MSSNADKAEAMFLEGYNCAQSVLGCCGERFGLDRQTALRMGEAFGGGMGRMGLTCGAVTGALMAIGLKHAKLTPDDHRSREKSIQLVRRFRQAFEARHGSISCRELLGCDISTPDGYQQAVEKKLFREVCPKLVRDAAEIVEQLLSTGEGKAP